ncbi:hypothetical protein F5884DRAFT_880561 [Xylogone sp. PMI_703]|nr:hypothetical protein F5884DRAFT_880561 [Xylogone sp. PMI_703]
MEVLQYKNSDNILGLKQWQFRSPNVPLGLESSLFSKSTQAHLEEPFFCKIHPHWPILHRRTFKATTKPPSLVHAVLVAGLWAINSPVARAQAEFYHDIVIRDIPSMLFECEKNLAMPRTPHSSCLASFQAYLIPLILATYREAGSFPYAIISHMQLFRLFQQSGVFNQELIDTTNSDPIAREQFQRSVSNYTTLITNYSCPCKADLCAWLSLALIHFKVFIHLNWLLIKYFPAFKPFQYISPKDLNIRVPSPRVIWDDQTKIAPQYYNTTVLTVKSLSLIAEGARNFESISFISRWDYSVGMIIWCFLTMDPDKSYSDLMRRLTPYLFLHKQDIDVN